MEQEFPEVTRIEIIDHTKSFEDGGGVVYNFWNEYRKKDSKNPKVSLQLQDDNRTLKIFIKKDE